MNRPIKVHGVMARVTAHSLDRRTNVHEFTVEADGLPVTVVYFEDSGSITAHTVTAQKRPDAAIGAAMAAAFYHLGATRAVAELTQEANP